LLASALASYNFTCTSGRLEAVVIKITLLSVYINTVETLVRRCCHAN
jgi:hypothetical protein